MGAREEIAVRDRCRARAALEVLNVLAAQPRGEPGRGG
jgi:hypothetical protein